LTKADVLSASPSVALDRLSPAEKYDLLQGRYDFPLARAERQRQIASVDPRTDRIPGWFGLCHGWAPATLLEREPGSITLRNHDGLEIPFYSSDIKALITKIYADYSPPQRSVGERCNVESHAIDRDENGRIVIPECRDVNPATLHLILADFIPRQQGFIADISAASEVWNQAIVGYRVTEMTRQPFDPASDPAARFRAPGTATLVNVKNEVSYITETMAARDPQSGNPGRYTLVKQLEYTLELNAYGEIIGGEWISTNAPDFLWRALRPDSGRYLDYGKVSQMIDLSRQ
jgi:hypothetical protein